jgi:site-specific DNA recombinase
MKIALYARVSSETQAKEGTIDSQIEALREYAKVNHLKIIQECIDDGYSGTTLVRPGLDQVRDLAQSGSIDGILILSVDRLSRKQTHQIVLIEEFKKQNIQLILTDQNFGDSPEDTFMLQIQGALAEYERTKILDRMRRGTIHAIKKGQVQGGSAPFGYRFIPKSNLALAHWEIDPTEAETVRIIFDLYINQDMKPTAIAKYLESIGVPSRAPQNVWWPSVIYGMLKNEAYTGKAYMFKTRKVEPHKSPKVNKYRRRKNSSNELRPKDDWIEITVPQIITLETLEKAQKLLKQNAHKSRRNNHKNQYLLRGLVVCGLCGSMANGVVSNQSTYYTCRAKHYKNVTTKPHDEVIRVKHKPFDDIVWAGLTELLNNPRNLKAQLENRLHTRRMIVAPSQSTDEFDKELKQLAREEKRILDAYREEIISMAELKEQKTQIANRRKVLEAKKKAILRHTEGLGQQKITMDMLGDVSARYTRVMAKANFATREKLVNHLVDSVALYSHRAVVQGAIPLVPDDALHPARQSADTNHRAGEPGDRAWEGQDTNHAPNAQMYERYPEFHTSLFERRNSSRPRQALASR